MVFLSFLFSRFSLHPYFSPSSRFLSSSSTFSFSFLFRFLVSPTQKPKQTKIKEKGTYTSGSLIVRICYGYQELFFCDAWSCCTDRCWCCSFASAASLHELLQYLPRLMLAPILTRFSCDGSPVGLVDGVAGPVASCRRRFEFRLVLMLLDSHESVWRLGVFVVWFGLFDSCWFFDDDGWML